MTSRPSTAPFHWYLILGAVLLICLPTLLLDYLPCTDLPQHLSVTSILKNQDDPAFGFSAHYIRDLGRTMYLLPYVLTLLLGLALPLPLALSCVVFFSLAIYPLSLMRLLKVLGKPQALCLLGLPLVYNSAFYWGFINFNLAIGMAMWGMALLLEEGRGWRGDVGLGLLGGLIVFTHLYGLALLLGFAGLVLLLEPRRSWRHQFLPLAPGLVGATLWPWPGAGVNPQQVTSWFGAHLRLISFPREVFGAYQDRSELLLLALLLGGFLLLALRRRGAAPDEGRWRGMAWADRALWLLLLLNLALYQVMPLHTSTAKFVHFRHALIAAMLLPALVPRAALVRGGAVARSTLAAVALISIVSGWWHLYRFDREARGFDKVVRRLPLRPRLLSMAMDANGGVMATRPYLHFAALVQARKGGLIATTFARFWNIPVRRRRGTRAPVTPDSFEWRPLTYNYRKFGYYYPWVLGRLPAGTELPKLSDFPYRLVLSEGPWRLYRKDKALLLSK